MHVRHALVLLALISVSLVNAQQSLNMEFLGNLNTRPDTAKASPISYSACWGYVAPDGREYALLGTALGTQIVDITDAPNLREVSFIPGPRNNWREMKTYRDVAYVVSEASSVADGAGVQIIDLSRLPQTATLVKTYVWTDIVNGSSVMIPRAHTVSVSGNYLYLNGGNFNGVRILDIHDPLNPVKAGAYNGPYVHDSHIRNDTIFAAAINSGGGVDIVDVRHKSNPVLVKRIQYPGSGTHNAWTTKDRRYVVTTDEIGTTRKSLKVWDIQDIQNARMVSEFKTDTSIVHNVVVKGDLAYVAWYANGVRVIDLSNPLEPKEVAFYDTYPGTPEPTYNGAWGVDSYFPSGKVIISDRQTGLYVVRYTGEKRGIVTGLVTNSATGSPIQGAFLHFKDATITRWTGANGQYLFGYASGTYSVLIEAPGYAPKEATVTVPEGTTTTANFTLSSTTSVGQDEAVPSQFLLSQNYPNPFNPTTTIEFSVGTYGHTSLRVFDVLGREVAVLANEVRSPGIYKLTWDARLRSANSGGQASALPSGIYLYRMVAGNFVETRKMVLTR